jgi:hypothetical protein
MVPLLVPFSRMFAPGIPVWSSADVTFPVTVFVCDHAEAEIKRSKTGRKYLMNR